MAKRKETEFEKLHRVIITTNEKTVERLMGVIKEESEDIRAEMRSGFTRMDQELAAIRAELKSIRADIKELQEAVKEHESYTKEIDHILQRVSVIERKLGIKHTAASR